ncbi:restriction endonuclease subunit S [Paucibacter sp. TC2R-5]|uniref:restriction endonuclease subunit S n=1 Tax=Paucibacter sp. TC2R-5 TaxID=2893555 RepID=UPI0021E4E29F|nr:restriction endonuclease subunit S [Paucibacter sp. TC2R-5]MCV2361665.1 restriction endonuclease subunit S [Paucibacter sp. TC2R-5]
MPVISVATNDQAESLPDSWSVWPLAEVAEVRGGIAKNSNVAVADAISVAYLRVANVQDGYFDLSEISRIEISKQDLKRYSVLPGDVLMNEGGDLDKLGRGAVWLGLSEPCVHQNHVFVVRCKPQLLPEFLNVWTSTQSARKFFLLAGKQTTNLASISKTSLGELPVALPPIAEQRAIATSLSDVDALIAGLERLIAKKRDIKQAAMQQLLTGQTRLLGFSGKWRASTLVQVAEITPGLNKPTSEMGSGALYVTVQDLYAGSSIEVARLGRIKASTAEVAAFALEPGDIVFGKSSVKREGIGYPSQFLGANEPTVFSGFSYRTRAKEGLANSSFLFYALRSSPTRRWLIDNSQASALTNINRLIAERIPLELPPTLDEQIAIAAVLSDMDSDLAALESRLAKTRALKQGMMQELLTGKTRLV